MEYVIGNMYRPQGGVEVEVNTEMLFKHCALPGAFVYIDKDSKLKQVCIERVLYSNPATIVFWDDGTKTTAKCFENDLYNPETGLAMCILKKLYGGAKMKNVIDAWMPKDANYWNGTPVHRNLHDVRKDSKK